MSDIATIRRQLKIKTGAAKRLLKEHGLYKKEADEGKMKVDKLIADGAEGWEVRNSQNLLRESEKMVADTSERLGTTVLELRDLVVAAKKEPELQQDPALLEGEDVLEQANL
ncbi:tubulin binding cofactor A [Gloeophyllum trabeum ATCC 11539]|uniref:Tubulin-specific chaperone A n=1 Tax=Gloeophyllum trabeum (strain ATCC 11539 / FP-39264 / Madison 617) TaxID=670483 RepID=S7QLE3_GLOTA|nr:tubulin binding cofactor A [Gloeophyllum trabeum ATCC 11539]EPQ60152.1 tubulin binding cofactor A [Gloeophyllum trabeum ATCC 11539]